MNGLELFLLGRKLMKVGQEAMPRSGFRRLPASVQSIIVDVFEHPHSSIGEITTRTGFPQSHVSTSVARLQKAGALVTEVDKGDRRRTLVMPAPAVVDALASTDLAAQVSASIDDALAKAVGTSDPLRVKELVAALETLAAGLLSS
jgi:DNA-binding MarR family transcriptional regulator